MKLDAGMHIVGALSLAVIAAVATFILVEAITVHRHRIIAALRLEPIPAAHPIAPRAEYAGCQDDSTSPDPALDAAA